MKKGSTTPATKRAIIEAELIEEFHWLPQDVKKIPYRDIQEFYIIRRQQRESVHQQQALNAQVAESKAAGVGSGRGQRKRSVQVRKLTP